MRLLIVEDDAPGLAIGREIAAGHGAAIAIGDGADGKGCQVALTFPHG
jgi:nitrogen fixation/metabolism regulation signal transduction histidine kinase